MASLNKKQICIKNLPHLTEQKVNELFGRFGKIVSFKIISSNDSTKKDALIEFESEEQSTAARNEMHGQIINENKLFVDFAPTNQILTTASLQTKETKPPVLERIFKANTKPDLERHSSTDNVAGKDGLSSGIRDGKGTEMKTFTTGEKAGGGSDEEPRERRIEIRTPGHDETKKLMIERRQVPKTQEVNKDKFFERVNMEDYQRVLQKYPDLKAQVENPKLWDALIGFINRTAKEFKGIHPSRESRSRSHRRQYSRSRSRERHRRSSSRGHDRRGSRRYDRSRSRTRSGSRYRRSRSRSYDRRRNSSKERERRIRYSRSRSRDRYKGRSRSPVREITGLKIEKPDRKRSHSRNRDYDRDRDRYRNGYHDRDRSRDRYHNRGHYDRDHHDRNYHDRIRRDRSRERERERDRERDRTRDRERRSRSRSSSSRRYRKDRRGDDYERRGYGNKRTPSRDRKDPVTPLGRPKDNLYNFSSILPNLDQYPIPKTSEPLTTSYNLQDIWHNQMPSNYVPLLPNSIPPYPPQGYSNSYSQLPTYGPNNFPHNMPPVGVNPPTGASSYLHHPLPPQMPSYVSGNTQIQQEVPPPQSFQNEVKPSNRNNPVVIDEEESHNDNNRTEQKNDVQEQEKVSASPEKEIKKVPEKKEISGEALLNSIGLERMQDLFKFFQMGGNLDLLKQKLNSLENLKSGN